MARLEPERDQAACYEGNSGLTTSIAGVGPVLLAQRSHAPGNGAPCAARPAIAPAPPPTGRPAHADPERERVAALQVIERASGPGSQRPADDGGQHQRAEDAGLVLA